MGRYMNWKEIQESFPNEWVAMVDYKPNGAIGIDGVVLVHGPEKKLFHQTLREKMKQHKNVAVRYTGQPLVKNPEIPLLWQISPTS